MCVRKCTERTTASCEVNKLGENPEETDHPKNEQPSRHLDFCVFQTSTMDTYSAFPFSFYDLLECSVVVPTPAPRAEGLSFLGHRCCFPALPQRASAAVLVSTAGGPSGSGSRVTQIPSTANTSSVLCGERWPVAPGAHLCPRARCRGL